MSEGNERPTDSPPGYPFWVRAERIRNDREWSQSELAERAGVTRKTYGLLPTQPNKATPRTISRLAAVLDIPKAEAMRLAGLDPADAIDPPAANPGDVLRLVEVEAERIQKMLDRLPPHRRERLERRHIEEQERFKNQLREAREAWRRTLGDLEERLALEIELSRRQPPDGDDDQEGGSRVPKIMQFQ